METDSMDRGIADLIAGQSEERRLEMEDVAAEIVAQWGGADIDMDTLINLTGIYAGMTGHQPAYWEVEQALRSVLAAQA